MSVTCPDSKNVFLVGGYTYPSEKYEFLSWDDDIPNIWKKKKNVPNHQPLLLYPKILQFDTVYHHFPLQVWGIRHFWTNKNVAEGKKRKHVGISYKTGNMFISWIRFSRRGMQHDGKKILVSDRKW